MASKLFHSFEFVTTITNVGKATEVIIDGVRAKGVVVADISYRINEIPVVELKFYADSIKVSSNKVEVQCNG